MPAGDCQPRILEGAYEAEALAGCAINAGDEIEAVEGSELALDCGSRLQRVGAAERRGADRDFACGAEVAKLSAGAVDLDHQARARAVIRADAPAHDVAAAAAIGVALDCVVRRRLREFRHGEREGAERTPDRDPIRAEGLLVGAVLLRRSDKRRYNQQECEPDHRQPAQVGEYAGCCCAQLIPKLTRRGMHASKPVNRTLGWTLSCADFSPRSVAIPV